jgi:hypothetical protein
MGVLDDIAAVRDDPSLTDDQKRGALRQIKATALVDVINNGKPAPNPIPPLVRRQFDHGGIGIYIHHASVTPDGDLRVEVTLTRAPALPVTHTIIIRNPPVLPRQISGAERQDLIQAAVEMLEGFV